MAQGGNGIRTSMIPVDILPQDSPAENISLLELDLLLQASLLMMSCLSSSRTNAELVALLAWMRKQSRLWSCRSRMAAPMNIS